MALSQQWLDELRARITLSGVIGRTTKLTRAGREWKACCPFHNEKTPSFTVNDEKGFYHCFGCQAHGDVIRWMTDHEGLPFMDALKELAARAGMEVPAPDPREAQRAEKRASLIDVTEAAQHWFVDNLRSADGAIARDYLAKRGFSDAVIREFGFGFAPDSKQAINRALSQFDEDMLVESGMRISVDEPGSGAGTKYDRFRARLMLPIQDARGRVIAFGGRILQDRDGVAKYLNSPDTPLFDKGRTLYNLHRASPAARKADRVIVVEGYMDVIALANAGIGEAVAPLGTALTEHQIERLWRMTDKPILCFDGDAAGQRAAMRAAQRALPLLRPGLSLQFVSLPQGKDPDDLLKEQGRDALEAILAAPKSLLETVWAHEQSAGPLASPEDKAGLKKRLLDHCDAIEHPDIRALYKRDWLEKFSAFAFPPRQNQYQSGGQRPKFGVKPWDAKPTMTRERAQDLNRAAGSQVEQLGRAAIAGLMRHPALIGGHSEALAGVSDKDPQLSKAVDILLSEPEALENPDSLPIKELERFTAPLDKNRYSFLSEDADPQAAREDLAEAVTLLVERPAIDAALADATARFDTDPEGAFAEQQRLRARKLAIDERMRHMARRRITDPPRGDLTAPSDPDSSGKEAGEHILD